MSHRTPGPPVMGGSHPWGAGLRVPPALWMLTLLALGVAAGAPPPEAGAADPARIDISDGCLTSGCHADMLERPKVHSAVELEQCDGCHVSIDDQHKFEPVADPPDLCLECHDPVATKRFVHEIVEMGECLACHDPHGSAVPELLVEDSVAATCAECHDQPAEEFPFPHGPARDGDCLACHEPHSAPYAKLLKLEEGDLCLSCHKRNQRRADGSYTKNIGQLIANAKYVHPPAGDGECLVCHGPHGGISPPSLAEAFPPGRYAPFSPDAYVLCFQCHDEELATEERTTETAFRDGTRNLHFVHVNRAKGRTCRLCHDPHGTNLPFMLRESVPFGQWSFPLRFEKNSTGGSCWPGCHQKVSYDRNAAAD